MTITAFKSLTLKNITLYHPLVWKDKSSQNCTFLVLTVIFNRCLFVCLFVKRCEKLGSKNYFRQCSFRSRRAGWTSTQVSSAYLSRNILIAFVLKQCQEIILVPPFPPCYCDLKPFVAKQIWHISPCSACSFSSITIGSVSPLKSWLGWLSHSIKRHLFLIAKSNNLPHYCWFMSKMGAQQSVAIFRHLKDPARASQVVAPKIGSAFPVLLLVVLGKRWRLIQYNGPLNNKPLEKREEKSQIRSEGR